MPADGYGELAADYHWLYDDVEQRLGTTTPGVRAALSCLEPGSRVLDAACGIGLDAVALTRSGFDVTACDASAAMVVEARRRLEDAGLAAEVHRTTWRDLPARLPDRGFDAVLCTGNSIAHAPDERAAVAALRAFRTMLRPGGAVVVDTHDWETMAERGSRTVVDPQVVDRAGTRCRRTYRWSWSERPWTCTLDIELELTRGDGRQTRTHRVDLAPFTAAELRHRLREAGLVEIEQDRRAGTDRYTSLARRPCRS